MSYLPIKVDTCTGPYDEPHCCTCMRPKGIAGDAFDRMINFVFMLLALPVYLVSVTIASRILGTLTDPATSPQWLVGILTLGGLWGEAILIVAALALKWHQLALGIVIGSTCANVLLISGIFHVLSAGQRSPTASTKLLIQLTVTTTIVVFATAKLPATQGGRNALGVGLLAMFAFYAVLVSISAAPGTPSGRPQDHSQSPGDGAQRNHERTPLLPQADSEHHGASQQSPPAALQQMNITFLRVFCFMLAFPMAITSGLLLAGSAGGFAQCGCTSETSIGIAFISVAFAVRQAFLLGRRGMESDAHALESAVFTRNAVLLGIGLGLVSVSAVDSVHDLGKENVSWFEVGVLLIGTIMSLIPAQLGIRDARLGILLIIGYTVFVGLEYTHVRNYRVPGMKMAGTGNAIGTR